MFKPCFYMCAWVWVWQKALPYLWVFHSLRNNMRWRNEKNLDYMAEAAALLQHQQPVILELNITLCYHCGKDSERKTFYCLVFCFVLFFSSWTITRQTIGIQQLWITEMVGNGLKQLRSYLESRGNVNKLTNCQYLSAAIATFLKPLNRPTVSCGLLTV